MLVFTLSSIVDIIGIMIAALGLFAIFYQLRQANRQQRLMLFTEYTQRFQNILSTAPNDFFKRDQSTQISCSVENLRTIRLYLDLCSEEYHLNKLGHIDKEVWKNLRE